MVSNSFAGLQEIEERRAEVRRNYGTSKNSGSRSNKDLEGNRYQVQGLGTTKNCSQDQQRFEKR